MANTDKTTIVDGMVQPRYYQVYGDLIESKEVMEPISIVAGSGPICGFDWVNPSYGFLRIESALNTTFGSSKTQALIRARSKKVVVSDKSNTFGQVFNAYNTPDGLIHVAPSALEFTEIVPSGGWPNLSNPTRAVGYAVKASHTYKNSNSESAPSKNNFKVYPLDLTTITLANLLSLDLVGMIRWLESSGSDDFVLNKNTDVLIGVYIIGWEASWSNDPDSANLKELMSDLNYVLCINPFNGILPTLPFGNNPTDVWYIKNKLGNLLEIPEKVDNSDRHIETLSRSHGSGVEVKYTIRDNTITFTKLIIKGCNFLASPSVNKSLPSNWNIDKYGIVIYLSNDINLDNTTQLTPIQVSKWGVGTFNATTGAGDVWDGTLNITDVPGGNKPVAGILIDSYVTHYHSTSGEEENDILMPSVGFYIDPNNPVMSPFDRLNLTLNNFIHSNVNLKGSELDPKKQDISTYVIISTKSFLIKLEARYYQPIWITTPGFIQFIFSITLAGNSGKKATGNIDLLAHLKDKESKWESLLESIKSYPVDKSEGELPNTIGSDNMVVMNSPIGANYISGGVFFGLLSDKHPRFQLILEGNNAESTAIGMSHIITLPTGEFRAMTGNLLFARLWHRLMNNPFKRPTISDYGPIDIKDFNYVPK